MDVTVPRTGVHVNRTLINTAQTDKGCSRIGIYDACYRPLDRVNGLHQLETVFRLTSIFGPG